MGDMEASSKTLEAAPIAYPGHHIVANTQNIRSELFWALLSHASTSKAHQLDIRTSLGGSTDWIRVPETLLEAFGNAPFTHLRTLIFRVTSHTTLSLLFDVLSFMPALRALEVYDHMPWDNNESGPEIPDSWYTAPLTLRLERLVYYPVIGLPTLVARVISPSAQTLAEIELQAMRASNGAPVFPRLQSVRSLRTTWSAEQALDVIRQCPALSHLAISVRTRKQLDALTTTLRDSGIRLHVLEIVWLPVRDLAPDDAAQLMDTLTALTTLRRATVRVRMGRLGNAALAKLVRDACRRRRIPLRF